MIINDSKDKTIVKHSKIVHSILFKAIGLMFSRPIRDFGLVFSFSREEIRPLHMFFVFYPIDVLFLDRKLRIAEIKLNLRPFSVYFPRKKSQHIIELPKGKAVGCSEGDMISFDNI